MVVLALPVAPVAADPGAEQQLLAWLNDARAANGLAPLASSGDLQAVARRHSVRMADADSLHHNRNLPNEVGGWRALGENVGLGAGARAVHDGFMASGQHRAQILGEYTQVGIGVEVRDGRVWVTQVFRLPTGAQAPAPTPPPPPPPPPPPHPPAAPPAPSAQPAPATSPASTVAPAPPAPPTNPALDLVMARITASEVGARVSDVMPLPLHQD